jgi:hypothetical protein
VERFRTGIDGDLPARCVTLSGQGLLKILTQVLKFITNSFIDSVAFVQPSLVFFENLDEYQIGRASPITKCNWRCQQISAHFYAHPWTLSRLYHLTLLEVL